MPNDASKQRPETGYLYFQAIFKTDEHGNIPAGSTAIAMDASTVGSAPSVGAIPEEELSRLLFTRHRTARSLLFSRLGLVPDSDLHFGVQAPFVGPNSHPGDIDVLAVPRDDPSRATAIEVKRVKISSQRSSADRVNKLGQLERGVKQASDLASLGFSRTWLVVVCVVDARESAAANLACRWASAETARAVIEEIDSCQMKSHGIGVLVLEVIQPAGRDILFEGAVYANVLREVLPRGQRPRVTEQLAEIRHKPPKQ